MGDDIRQRSSKIGRQSVRRRLAIACVAACPLALSGGCYGHGHYSYHHGSSSYRGHYHHGHRADALWLPFIALYLLFNAAGSC